MGNNKTLYWVKFVDQDRGNTVDTYFIARNLQHLEEEIADILEVKAIKSVQDLTSEYEPTPRHQEWVSDLDTNGHVVDTSAVKSAQLTEATQERKES